MELDVDKAKKSKAWIFWVVLAGVVLALVLVHVSTVTQAHAHGTIHGDVLYLNSEEIYVYSSLESALTDTKGEDGPPKPLKEFLPEILAEEKLVYLEGTTVGVYLDGICMDKQIPENECRTVYRIGNYFLAESIPSE